MRRLVDVPIDFSKIGAGWPMAFTTMERASSLAVWAIMITGIDRPDAILGRCRDPACALTGSINDQPADHCQYLASPPPESKTMPDRTLPDAPYRRRNPHSGPARRTPQATCGKPARCLSRVMG